VLLEDASLREVSAQKRGRSDSRMWWEDIIKNDLWEILAEGNQDNQLSAEK